MLLILGEERMTRVTQMAFCMPSNVKNIPSLSNKRYWTDNRIPKNIKHLNYCRFRIRVGPRWSIQWFNAINASVSSYFHVYSTQNLRHAEICCCTKNDSAYSSHGFGLKVHGHNSNNTNICYIGRNNKMWKVHKTISRYTNQKKLIDFV